MATKAGNPFYKNEQEMKELIAARDAFAFDEPRETIRSVAVLAGPEGTGKTHLACTMSEKMPVYVLDTEYRADIVVRKFRSQQREVKLKVVRSWKELVVAVKAIIKNLPPGAIVFDSASDLQTFAEIAYLERTKADRIYPNFNWTEVWAMCNALVDDVKFSGHLPLFTARVKEEYVNDKGTGRFIPQLYKTLPYKADFIVQFPRERSKPLFTVKNGFNNEVLPEFARTATLPEIIALFEATAQSKQADKAA